MAKVTIIDNGKVVKVTENCSRLSVSGVPGPSATNTRLFSVSFDESDLTVANKFVLSMDPDLSNSLNNAMFEVYLGGDRIEADSYEISLSGIAIDLSSFVALGITGEWKLVVAYSL